LRVCWGLCEGVERDVSAGHKERGAKGLKLFRQQHGPPD